MDIGCTFGMEMGILLTFAFFKCHLLATSQIKHLQFIGLHTSLLLDDVGILCQYILSGEGGKIHRQMATSGHVAPIFTEHGFFLFLGDKVIADNNNFHYSWYNETHPNVTPLSINKKITSYYWRNNEGKQSFIRGHIVQLHLVTDEKTETQIS